MSNDGSDIYDAFTNIPTGNICDSNGLLGALIGIHPVDRKMAFCGRALTVRCDPLDNLPIHKAVAVAKPGDVIVVDCSGCTEAGAFGEMLAISCVSRGIRAFVTNGSVRDSQELTLMGFPTYSAGVCPNGTRKLRNKGVGEELVISGVTVRMGDVVVGDADGVAVVPLDKAAAVLEAARKKAAAESAMRSRLAAGETVAEILGINDKLWDV